MRKLICALLALTFIFAMIPGCAGSGEPTLSIVYLAGNETDAETVPGRALAETTRGLFGTTGKNNDYSDSLEPGKIAASRSGGTLKLVFSCAAENVKVRITDGSTGDTQELEPENSIVDVEGGKSYGVVVTADCTSGSSVYQMEYAFDLIYSPEVGEIGDIEMPQPEQSAAPSSQPQQAEQPEQSPEVSGLLPEAAETAAPENSVYTQPPQLTVLYNDQSYLPKMGTTSWNYRTADGKGSGFNADSNHPLLWKNYVTVERIYGVDEMWITFPVRPDKITVTQWKDTFAADPAAVSDDWLSKIDDNGVEVTIGSDGHIDFDTGYRTGYIYVVECSWKNGTPDEGEHWGGSTVYAFALSETNY